MPERALIHQFAASIRSIGIVVVFGMLMLSLMLPHFSPATGVSAQEDQPVAITITGPTADAFAADHLNLLTATFSQQLAFLGATVLPPPVTVQLLDDQAAFTAATLETAPIADLKSAVIAIPAAFTIAVDLPRFSNLAAPAQENQIRHAIAHITFGFITGQAALPGFVEGFAVYVERPNDPVLARMSARVQSAYDLDRLISWFNINRLDSENDPELVAAESFAIIGFLIRQYGLPEFQRFALELATADSWRDAMKTAYAPATSDNLERQWREKLSIWFAGDWKWNLMAGFDLSAARNYLVSGNFGAAENALLVSEQLLRDIDDPTMMREMEELQAQAHAGGLAEEKMRETQQALENFAYDRADAALIQAIAQYDTLPANVRPSDTIAAYQTLIATGLQAETYLDQSRMLSGNWGDYPEARADAVEAANGYASLGDATMHTEATSLVNQLDLQRRRLVLLLGGLALLSLTWLAIWLRARGRSELRWNE